jgi:hypothetical protein
MEHLDIPQPPAARISVRFAKKLVPKTTYDYLLKLPRSQMQLYAKSIDFTPVCLASFQP